MAIQELVKKSVIPWNDAKEDTLSTAKERIREILEELATKVETATHRRERLDIIESIVTLYASKDYHGTTVSSSSLLEDVPLFQRLEMGECPLVRGFQDAAVDDSAGNVPRSLLARLCDVAVLKLLCRCAHSSPGGSTYRCLTWTLKYVSNLLGTLSSTTESYGVGWYGVQIRARKSPSSGAPPNIKPSSQETLESASHDPGIFQVNLEQEMSTCVTSEGRISLVGILAAISALPASILDLSLLSRIRPILHWCLDLGVSNTPGSSTKVGVEKGAVSLSVASSIYSREIVKGVLDVIAKCLSKVTCFKTDSAAHCQMQARAHFGDDETKNSGLKQVVLSMQEKHFCRIFNTQTQHYRQWLVNYVKVQPICEVFRFLHSVLGYCSPSLSPDISQSMLSIAASTAAIAFRPILDRFMQFELTDSTVESSFLRSNILEVCQYINYCQHLQQPPRMPALDAVDQLHKQVQRVALSAVFASCCAASRPKPPPPATTPIEEELGGGEGTGLEAIQRSDDLAGALRGPFSTSTAKSSGGAISSSSQETSLNFLRGSRNAQAAPPTQAAPPFMSDDDLCSLQFRLQRLSVLMELSEPGTVPSAEMLASMLDFTGRAPVVARAAVFVECAHFVHRLKSGVRTAWVISGVGNHRTALLHLKRWGEVLGAKLQEILNREKQPSFANSGRNLDTPAEGRIPAFSEQVLEESVLDTDSLPRHPQRKQKKTSVSFALKAAACQLLQEISLILLDQPRMYQVSLHSHVLDFSHGPPSLSVVKTPDHSSLEFSQPKYSFKRRVARQSLSRSQVYEDVVRHSVHRRNPNISVVFAEPSSPNIRPHSFQPNQLDPSGDSSSQVTRSTQKLLKSNQVGNRLTQNFSKLFSSIGLRSTQRHSPTVRRKSTVRAGAQGRMKGAGTPSTPLSSDPFNPCHLPWLEAVAELLLPSTICASRPQCTYSQSFQHRKKQCEELSYALNCIYSRQPPAPVEDAPEETPVFKKDRKGSKWTLSRLEASKSTSRQTMDRQSELTRLLSPPPLSPIDGIGSGLRAGVFPISVGCLALPIQLERDAMLVSMEEVSIVDTKQRIKSFTESRLQYLSVCMPSAMSPIFSTVMTQTAELSDRSALREALWECLLDSDQDIASLAGGLFLLVCERSEHSDLMTFFNKRVDGATGLTRFRSLWDARYKVFPKIPRDVHRRIHCSERHKTAYALPPQQIGKEVKDIPLPPWQPVTFCSGECARVENKKCSTVTEYSPVLVHTTEILGLAADVNVSAVSVTQKASNDSSHLVIELDEQQRSVDSTDRSWQFAVFPDSLLPLILRVLSMCVDRDNIILARFSRADKLDYSSGAKQMHRRSDPVSKLQHPDYCELSTMILARDLVYNCLVDDYIIFFQPFLHLLCEAYHEFTRRAPTASGRWKKQTQYSMQNSVIEDTDHAIHGLRMLLLCCPTIPPEGARYLFNHLTGIVMQYCLHHNAELQRLISAMLDILQLLSAHVPGLNVKLLKNSLKKETCYPTIMTTARIIGMNKATVYFKKSEKSKPQAVTVAVPGEMTAQALMAEVLHELRSSIPHLEPLSKYSLHLLPKEFDGRKFIPSSSTKLCKTLVLRDHFISRGEPTLFDIEEEEDCISQKLFDRDQMLHLLMSEVQRLVFARKLIKIGGNEEESFIFMHAELVELASFPRKALNSVYSQPSLLSFSHLRSADIMVKGAWLQFICSLFKASPNVFKWSSDLMLFLSAICGSLLLHADEGSVLRMALSALVSVIARFPTAMKDEASELIISTLIQVYAVHSNNSLVCNSLCHLWSQMHTRQGTEFEFLLEVPSAALALLQEETAGTSPLHQGPGSFVSALLMHRASLLDTSTESLTKAVFNLLSTLGDASPPVDVLGIEEVAGVNPIDQWQPTALSKIFNLYVTVVHAGVDKLRGIQTVLFLEYMVPLMTQQVIQDGLSIGPYIGGVKNLARACETLGIHIHRLRNDGVSARETQGRLLSRLPTFKSPKNHSSNLPSSFSAGSGARSANRRSSVSVEGGSSLRRVRHEHVLSSVHYTAAPAVAILNVATHVMVACKQHSSSLHTRLSRRESHFDGSSNMDAKTVMTLSTVAIQVVKQLSFSDTADLPPLNGFINFATRFLPSVNWSDEANSKAFGHYLYKATRLMYRMACEPSRAKNQWPCLTATLKGISTCLQHPQLVQQHQDAIVCLIDTILNVNIIVQAVSLASTPEQNDIVHKARNAIEFLKLMPSDFSRAIVGLCKTILIMSSNTGHRYYMRTIFHQKVRIPDELAKALLVRKVLIPLLIAIGGDSRYRLDVSDLFFLMDSLNQHATSVIKLMTSGHKYPLKDTFRSFFLGLKVICSGLSSSMSSQAWLGLTQIIIRIGLEKVLKNQIHYDDLILYFKELLVFIEEFVLIHPSPLRMYIWPALDMVENCLTDIQEDLLPKSPREESGRESSRASLEETGRQASGVEENLSMVDTSLQICHRIKDSFLEDYEQKTAAELLEGFDTELHGGLFDVRDAPEGKSRRTYRHARQSISDYLSRTTRHFFSNLHSSSISKQEDLPKIDEDGESDGTNTAQSSQIQLTSSSALINPVSSLPRRYQPSSSFGSILSTPNSSDSEEDIRPVKKGRIQRFKLRSKPYMQSKSASYEEESCIQDHSPIQPTHPDVEETMTVSVDFHDSQSSKSSETYSFAHSPSANEPQKKLSVPAMHSSPLLFENHHTPSRKLSEGSQLSTNLLQLPSQHQRTPSPILVSQRTSPTNSQLSVSPERRCNLKKSPALEGSPPYVELTTSVEPLIVTSTSSNGSPEPKAAINGRGSHDNEQFRKALLLANAISEDQTLQA